MKKFFAKASKPFAINADVANDLSRKKTTKDASGSRPSVDLTNTPHITTGLQPKYTVPAVPHPCPHDHLAIGVAREGLLIRPYDPKVSRKKFNAEPSSFLKVSWRTAEVTELHYDGERRSKNKTGSDIGSSDSAALLEQVDWDEAVIVYGIVGVLELFSCPYLLVINSRGEVGNVLDPSNTVYSVNGVTAIPLVDDRARGALAVLASRNATMCRPNLLRHFPRVQFSTDDEVKVMTPTLTPATTTEDGDNLDVASIERPPSALSFQSDISTPSSENSIATSPVFKTLASRLSFWTRLSKRTTTPDALTPSLAEFPLAEVLQPTSLAEESEALDKLIKEQEEPAKVVEAIVNATAPPPTSTEEKHKELEDKVIREVIRELTKGGMYFAYTFDITRSLQHKQEQVAKSQKKNDLLQGLGAITPPAETSSRISYHPKLDGGEVVALAEPNPTLPLWRRVDSSSGGMSGWRSRLSTLVEGEDLGEEEVLMADYIIVSRRSRYRAGLRYQRRGVDEEAHVANFVETEAIMRIERDKHQNVFSYVQIRGSIPLFWTQSGYSLKPPPVLAPDRTHDQHLEALSKHFKRTLPLYGSHTIVNLAEQGGREGAITQAYREYAVEFNDKDVNYCEYDFHKETKGMKYEKISKLVESMEKVFASQGYLWISDRTPLSHQKGVFRVNCIDCLDRTNVVQSAFARYVLSQQLSAVAVRSPLVGERSAVDLIFNDVWANNGDAISRAYAGTSALKGDFTRTGKRDLSGMLNDGVNSLARMYTATFGDWFSQAVIDFMLGYRTKAVFSEFLLKLQSTDPRDLIRLSKIRAEAVATCASRVLPEGEHLRSGWTLFAPEDVNVKVGLKFEEKVLLLSSKALYIVSYDYTLEKVKLYIRVPLGDIIGITKGAYILSPLEESSRDPEQNYGFLLRAQ
ncbi:hypothetical protein NMY22_g17862 [Coprinellus aureogranulatus]|nr:hypothetical protein NMY22_g17862 [Coprinellus aureogranulatus]